MRVKCGGCIRVEVVTGKQQVDVAMDINTEDTMLGASNSTPTQGEYESFRPHQQAPCHTS
jgi:hypothetical protein